MNQLDQFSIAELARLGATNQPSEIDRVLARLSPSQQKTFLEELLPLLKIDGSLNQFQDQGLDITTYGGKLGLNIPIDKDKLNVAVSGSGYKGKSPFGSFGKSEITGGEATYSTGPHQIGASYQKMGVTPSGEQMKNLVNLIYKYKF